MHVKISWEKQRWLSMFQCAECQGSSSVQWSDGLEVLDIALSVVNATKINGYLMAKSLCS